MKSDSFEPVAIFSTQKANTYPSSTEHTLPMRGMPPLDINRDYELWKFRMESILTGSSPQAQYSQIMLALSDVQLLRAITVGILSVQDAQQ
ncbi:unnamed protein product [Trichobilharzia regenti]|nr:unnamed protein product [Trichobilharzia regenti]